MLGLRSRWSARLRFKAVAQWLCKLTAAMMPKVEGWLLTVASSARWGEVSIGQPSAILLADRVTVGIVAIGAGHEVTGVRGQPECLPRMAGHGHGTAVLSRYAPTWPILDQRLICLHRSFKYQRLRRQVDCRSAIRRPWLRVLGRPHRRAFRHAANVRRCSRPTQETARWQVHSVTQTNTR